VNAKSVRPEPKLLTGARLSCDLANNPPDEHRRGFEPDSFHFIEEIHVRAETVTPVLKEILDLHPPEHWTTDG
jgi:hypothetical protein